MRRISKYKVNDIVEYVYADNTTDFLQKVDIGRITAVHLDHFPNGIYIIEATNGCGWRRPIGIIKKIKVNK